MVLRSASSIPDWVPLQAFAHMFLLIGVEDSRRLLLLVSAVEDNCSLLFENTSNSNIGAVVPSILFNVNVCSGALGKGTAGKDSIME